MGNHRGVGLKSEIDFFGVQSLDLGPNLQVFRILEYTGPFLVVLGHLKRIIFKDFS